MPGRVRAGGWLGFLPGWCGRSGCGGWRRRGCLVRAARFPKPALTWRRMPCISLAPGP